MASSSQHLFQDTVVEEVRGKLQHMMKDAADAAFLALAEKEASLLQKEKAIAVREARVAEREAALLARESSTAMPRRAVCNNCTRGFFCSRASPCFDPVTGENLHHHNCRSCYKEWKAATRRGDGKGR